MKSQLATLAIMSPDDAKKVRRRNIVAALLQVEGAALLSLGAVLIIKSIHSHLEAPLALVGVVIFTILGAAALLVSAKGFRAGRNYGRAPAILFNLIALGVSYFQMQAHLWVVALPLAAISLATLVLALSIIPN